MMRTAALHGRSALGIIVLVSVGVLLSPVAAVAGSMVFIAAAVAARFRASLPQLFLVVLGLCLLGYAFLGRGFAYLGAPPLYVGELTLGFGLVAIVFAGGLGSVFRSPLAWLLLLYMLVGAGETFPYVSRYGLNAFRDGVLWGYGAFAFLTAAFLLASGWLPKALRAYARTLPWFLVWAPLAVVLSRFAVTAIPTVPGSATRLISLKDGDIAVHLAGSLAFLVLGLHRAWGQRRGMPAGREWLWWTLWIFSAVAVFSGRAAILTVATVTLLLLLIRPFGRWGKLLFLVGLLLVAFTASGVRIHLGERSVSPHDLLLTAGSIFHNTGKSMYDGSRDWRLAWWTDIVQYTVFGRYFWTGKGFGINLADADGFQVTSDHSLRAPHSSHFDILARGGVPMAVSWVVLQLAFAWSVFQAYRRAQRRGRRDWANVDLWLLVYWLAFMVNASFDVYLEGPQGGIWFWALFGTGLAALELQRRNVALATDIDPQ